MLNDPFMQNVNKTISDNMRFVKNFQPSATSTSPTPAPVPAAPSALDTMMQYMNPMMMMMMFRMMDAIITKMEGGTPQPGGSSMMPYIPGLNGADAGAAGGTTGGTAGGTTATDTTGTGSIANNPAVPFLQQMFDAKAEENPDAQEIQLTDADVDKVRAALKDGTYQPSQIGQALKYELDQASDRDLPGVTKIISGLVSSGDLNVTPFLQNSYIDMLTPARQKALLGAVEQNGLMMGDGTINNRLSAFILDNLNRDDMPATQSFLRNFLQDSFTAQAQTPDSAAAKALTQVLALAGVNANDAGELVFPTTTAATTTDTTAAGTTTATDTATTAAGTAAATDTATTAAGTAAAANAATTAATTDPVVDTTATNPTV